MNTSDGSNRGDQLRPRLAGQLIAATPVPFDSSGRFHAKAHESYICYMSSQPIGGVAVWAHTGRGLMLDAETARMVMQDWRSALSEKVVIAGVGAKVDDSNISQAINLTLKMAETARMLGADALLVYPPTWLRNESRNEKLIVEHHYRVSQLGLPVILFYLYEDAGGINYSASVLDELLSLPNVVGIKLATLDSVMTYQDISRQLKTKHPEKLLLTGEDRFLGYSLQRGAQGALIGMGAVCCELQAELISAHCQGNADRFLALSDLVDSLAEVLFVRPMEGYIQRVLWALVHAGVIPADAAYDPWGPQLPASDFDQIGNVVTNLTADMSSERLIRCRL